MLDESLATGERFDDGHRHSFADYEKATDKAVLVKALS